MSPGMEGIEGTRAALPSPDSPFAYVDDFNPESTNDPVMIKLFSDIDKFAKDELVALVIRIQLQKLWHIRQLKAANANDLDSLVRSLNTLSVVNQAKSISYEEISASKFDKDVRACIYRTLECRMLNGKVKKHAWTAVEILLKSRRCELPGVCRRRHFDDLLNGLYGVSSDLHHANDGPSSADGKLYDPEEYFEVHVITFLRLCGGRPAAAKPLTLPRNITFSELLKALTDVQLSHQSGSTSRLGGITLDMVEQDAWFRYQVAPSLSALTERVEDWTPIYKDFPKIVRKAPIYVMQTVQREMPAAIRAKVIDLEIQHSEGIEDTNWNNWAEVQQKRGQGMMFTPPEFVPAPSNLTTLNILKNAAEGKSKKAANKRLRHRRNKRAEMDEKKDGKVDNGGAGSSNADEESKVDIDNEAGSGGEMEAGERENHNED